MLMIKTPAYIFDIPKFTARLKQFSDLRQKTCFKLLYSIKALPLPAVLEKMLPYIDGFSTSSLFEAKLAREVISDQGSVHITTPGFRKDELVELINVCDYLSVNSLNQWKRFSNRLQGSINAGIRINPQLSFLDDDRYDPCRKYSKLGVSIDQVQTLEGISGLHFHTLFGARSVVPLRKTIKKIEAELGNLLHQHDWINIGGGYIFNDPSTFEEFEKIVCYLSDRYDLMVFFEPGKGIINDAGELVAEVIDLFESEGKNIAVLDSSVSNHPEVFEYQQPPKIKEAVSEGEWRGILAGSSCKSGDLFGEYSFPGPLKTGTRITLVDVGAYSLVKANRFNGINLPDVYLKKDDGKLELIRHFDYSDYKNFWKSD